MILEREVLFPSINVVVIKVMLDQNQFVRHVVRPNRVIVSSCFKRPNWKLFDRPMGSSEEFV